MPMANYCRKCKAEVAAGESCPYCGGKLTQSGERISFGVTRLPVKDWFAWNALLRVALPVIALATVTVLVAESIAGGAAGVAALIRQGFLWTMLIVLGVTLLLIFLLLILQGRENVHYVLDKDGAHALTYLVSPTDVQLCARFTSMATSERLEQEGDALEGFTLVRRVFLPWSEIRRVRLWRENLTLLFFRPSFWQALAIRCPMRDFPEAEAYVRKKLKRMKKVRVVPAPKKEANM